MKLSGSNIKKFLIFSYILGNRNREKNSSFFRRRKSLLSEIQETSYILGNGTFKSEL